jgi:hypothetical protein
VIGVRQFSRTSNCGRRSRISTTSAFPSGLCTPVVRQRTVSSSPKPVAGNGRTSCGHGTLVDGINTLRCAFQHHDEVICQRWMRQMPSWSRQNGPSYSLPDQTARVSSFYGLHVCRWTHAVNDRCSATKTYRDPTARNRSRSGAARAYLRTSRRETDRGPPRPDGAGESCAARWYQHPGHARAR